MKKTALKFITGKQIILRISSLIFWALLVSALFGTARARQLQIVTTDPQPNAVDVPFNAAVEIRFSDPVSAQDLRGVTISGDRNGYYEIAEVIQRTNTTLAIVPNPVFVQGEQITVTLNQYVTSQGGQSLTAPGYQFSFRVQNLAGLFRPNILPSDTLIQDIQLQNGEQQPVKIAAANFDTDPFLEAVLVSSTSSTVTIFDNDGTQLLLKRTLRIGADADPERTPLDVAVADFDSNGTMDIIVPFSSNRVYILWGNGDATFDPQPVFDLLLKTNDIGAQPNGIAVADFNFDGLPDFAVSSVGANTIIIYYNMLRSDGRGAFREQVRPSAKTETGIFGLTSADFNADGLPDVAAIYNGTNALSVFLNRGGAGYAEKAPINIPLRPIAVQSLNVVEDRNNALNIDFPELVVLSAPFAIIGKSAESAAGQSQVTVLHWLPEGEGRFEIVDEIVLPNLVQSFGYGSLDGRYNVPVANQDHDLDLLTGDYELGTLALLGNEGTGLSAPRIVNFLPTPRAMAVADFNRDGIEDVFYASHDAQLVRLVRSTGLPDTTIVCDFGDVFVGQHRDTTKQISLRNSFDVQVTMNWDDRTNFDVQPRTYSLQGGELLPLTLSFAPRDTGSFAETVSVAIDPNPGGRDPVTILLLGRGVMVDFSIEPDSCFFPVTPPDSVSVCSLQVANKGNGILELGTFAIESATLAFSVQNRQPNMQVQGYDSALVLVAFAPADTGTYADTLLISSNDENQPLVRIPLYGRSTRNQPIYCAASPDTVFVVEHQPFCFSVTQGTCSSQADSLNGCVAGVFEDPDQERLNFRFRQLPGWIRSTTFDSEGRGFIRGTPGEGAQDTSFVVIAEKAFVSTEKQIFIKVISVNDAPVFTNLPDTVTIAENQELQFQVLASDPEGADVAITALNLENLCGNSASFDATTATLRYTPTFGCAGEFLLDFAARELTPDSLTSFASLVIRVEGAEPDLVMDGIAFSVPDIRLNQRATITAQFHNENAPVRAGQDFSARIFVNGEIVQSRRYIAGLDTSAVDSIAVDFIFDRTQQFSITAEVDFLDQIAELNEENNVVTRELTIEAGQLVVRPNPFTPNGDGKNDLVFFAIDQLALDLPIELTIFDVQGRLLRSLSSQGSQTQIFWDGRDSSDEEQLPGVYLYVLKDANNKSLQGYVVLAR